jgi:DNA polymerase V
VGFGATKTLAKLANRVAKKRPELGGVCVIDNGETASEILSRFKVEDLWGIGYQYARMLKQNGIRTAAHLRDADDDWVRERMTINGLRLVYELRGYPCRRLEGGAPQKKTICAAPSFGKMIPDLRQIQDALTNHLCRAGEKLRRQDSLCGTITVFIHTNKFRKTPGRPDLPSKQYYNSRSVDLPHPTRSTPELLRYALEVLKSIYAPGYHYQKVGLILSDLVPGDYRQKGVFSEGPDERLIQLANVIDWVNARHGQDKLRLASQLYNPEWPMKRQYLSRRYTTNWKEILEVK